MTRMGAAFIIKCNDADEAIALDEETANMEMKRRKTLHFEQNRYQFPEDEYRNRFYWHIREVPLV